MQSEQQTGDAREIDLTQDVSVVNEAEPDQLWLCALAEAVPPGTRIVRRETVRERLGLSDETSESLVRILFLCAGTIAAQKLTPASMLNVLVSQHGMEMERATLIVDVATFSARFLREAPREDLPLLAQRLESMEGTLKQLAERER